MIAASVQRLDPPAERPRILIVEGDPLASRALRRVLEGAGAEVIAEASAGREAIDLSRRTEPDIAFVGLPLLASLEVIEQMTAMDLGIRAILLTIEHDVGPGVAAIRSGARGLVSKADLLASDLPRLLSSAMEGDLVCSRSMATALIDRLLVSPVIGYGYRPVRSRLTDREWEILDLLCALRSTSEIAEELVISIETVRTHLKNIMRKLNSSSRAETIALAPDLRHAPTNRGPRALTA